MRMFSIGRFLKLLDPGLLLAIALTFFVAKPLLVSTGIPRGHDTNHHLLRMASMHRSWTRGEVFPSWAEATYWGYGSPLFHFYGSFTYHITSALQFVFNLNIMQALRWLLLLCYLMCGAGMYLFCQRRSGKFGALLGGLIYVNSPYLFLVNADFRGAFPELFALSLFPLLLWRIDALRDAPNSPNFIIVLLLEVALINSHNLSAVMITGAAFAWLTFEAVIQRINREASQLGGSGDLWAALALLLGILAAANFWLPVLLEADTVSLEALFWDINKSFWRSLGKLLQIPNQFYASDQPGFIDSLRIGFMQWTYALVGLCGALALYIRGYRTRHPQTFLAAVFFFGLSVPLIFMLTPRSLSLWDGSPIVRYLQFPWRLLGPLAVCLAYLASLNGFLLSRLPRALRLLAFSLAIAAPVVSGFAISRAMIWDHDNINVSAEALITARGTGATYRNELFPSTASQSVDRSRLLGDYADGYPIDKFDHSLLPPRSQVTLLHNAPESHAWRISSPTPFEATILNFWWPGWKATVDGRSVPIVPSAELGLISVSLPAGDYTLRVFLGSTPPRDAGALISALALIAGVVLAWRLQRLRIRPRRYIVAPPLTTSEFHGLFLAGAIIVVCFIISFL